MSERKMWVVIVVLCTIWLCLLVFFVDSESKEEENLVNMELTIQELEAEVQRLSYNSKIDHGFDTSLYANGITVKIDEKGNKILFINPKGRIEMFCDGFYVNGERVER